MEDHNGTGKSYKPGKERSMLFTVILAVGVLILLTGMLLGNIRGVIHQPDYNSEEFDGYETTTRWFNFFSSLIINIGMVVIACGSIMTAMFNPRLPPALRAGFVVAGGLILGFRFG
jgi:hypothetical protein